MQNYKLVVSDLDGTLLNDSKQISKENREAIARMEEKGVSFAISTGRTYGEISKEIRQVEEVRYIVSSDGAVIYDKKSGKRECVGMDSDLVSRVLSLLEEYRVSVTVRHEGVNYINKAQFSRETMTTFRVDRYFCDLILSTAYPVEDFSAFCRRLDNVEMICAFFRFDSERAECAKRLEEAGLRVVSSHPANLEIVSMQAGKGNGLLRLAKKLGVSPEQVIAVGDSLNDVAMLSVAGKALVMKNASDAVKELGDEVICTNEEHCAAYILEHYLS